MNLSDKQKEIINTKESKVVVAASAAGGKTLCLTQRVKYLLNKGINPKSIVVITFTKAAAEEMRKRIGDIGKGTFISTVHAYANYLLLSHGIDTSDLLLDENFDELFNRISEHRNCIVPVEHLIIDEAQDCDTRQFTFLLDYIKPKNYFIVGDIRQTIYGWRDSRPDILIKLMDDPEVTTYKLNENYRNGRKIVSFAKTLIYPLGGRYIDNTIPMRKEAGRVVQMDYDIDNIADKILFGNGEFRDWFVLTRTNQQLEEVAEELYERGIPVESFKKSEIDNESLREKLMNNTVKVLTIHTSKGLEAKNVIVVGVYMQRGNDESFRIAYVAATRARDQLIWCKQKKKKKKKDIVSWE